MGIVRLRKPELKHLKAVGTSGKRSVMLSCVVALALEDGEALSDLWKELRAYKLDKPFVDLLQSGQETVSNAHSSKHSDQPSSYTDVDGLEISVVCGCVPV